MVGIWEHDGRLTSGRYAVYQWDCGRSLFPAKGWLNMVANLNQSSPKPGHTTGGSGRGGARQGGGAGRGRAGRDADGSVRQENNRPSYPPDNQKTTRLDDSLEAGTSEILRKPMGEQNQGFTHSLSAGPRALFVPGC